MEKRKGPATDRKDLAQREAPQKRGGSRADRVNIWQQGAEAKEE